MEDFDFDLDLATEAAERWNDRQEKRISDEAKLNDNLFLEVETPERIAMNMSRITKAIVGNNTSATMPTAIIDGPISAVPINSHSFLDDIARERIIGKSELMGIEFMERGIAVGRFVGRVNIKNNFGQLVGYGTGFMVSPRLLLTNNHVLKTKQSARNSLIEFDFQLDRLRNPLPVAKFKLEPEVFFNTNKELDYTLVAVSEISLNNVPISHYCWNRLIEEEGKILKTQPVNIIQHPNGEYKQIVLRENNLIDLLPNYAHYNSDTQPGSSGSPVFSDLWEVVALHHSGVPRTDDNRNLIAKDGTIWRRGMDPKMLDWVANEGIRVSVLVNDIKSNVNNLSNEARQLVDDLLYKESPNPLEVKEEYDNSKRNPVSVSNPLSSAQNRSNFNQTDGEASWTIPLQINIGFGIPQLQISPPIENPKDVFTTKPVSSQITATADTEESVSIDPDYQNRSGYKVNFLGNGNKRVHLPKLTNEMNIQAARNKFGNDDNPFELKYHHSSIVMNKVRRLAFFTAVNIDGDKAKSPNRETDRWFFDPRIKKDEQISNELYENNPLDRGHLVRRLDPAWGDNDQMVKTANDDTFHWTNCSPQHKNFNRGKNIWAGLEDYILKSAKNKDFKVSVFTGPVFSGDDSEHRGVKIPKQYWKVVIMIKSKKQLSATAYIVSQSKLIENLEADFAFGQFKTFQTSIENIEQLTGLDFGNLKSSQPSDTESLVFEESVSENELSDYSEIKL